MRDREQQFPAGAAVTAETLDERLHEVFAELRAREPISWVPVLGAWVVASHELAGAVMRDSVTFTVDDPRFATAQVLGPSMLSLDGAEHARHRDPFAEAFRIPEVRRRFSDAVAALGRQIVAGWAPRGHAELRRDLAGPLAARVMELALDLVDGDPATLLGWYAEIVAAVTAASTGQVSGPSVVPPAVDDLTASVVRTIDAGHGVLADATRTLAVEEIVSNTGVMLFGGIETSEGMTTNLFAHLLAEPELWSAVAADRSLVANAVEESLRLEPAVVRVDRFATRDVRVGPAQVARGDFVIVALAAANRDPATFLEPDRFDLWRANSRQHLTFAKGPHTCPGMHLARLETHAAVVAALDLLPGLRLDPTAPASVPSGTVFRKPDRLDVVWNAGRARSTASVGAPNLEPMSTSRPSHEEVKATTDETARTMTPQRVPVNAYEAPGAFVVVAPFPAVTDQDVTVELTADGVRFFAELRSAGPREYLIHEWEYGGYERSLEVPAGFGSGVEASLTNGQLVVRVLSGDFSAEQRIHPSSS